MTLSGVPAIGFWFGGTVRGLPFALALRLEKGKRLLANLGVVP